MCVCVPLRRFTVLIQQRWSRPWWGGLQCGSWSTLQLRIETATPAGWQWNSSSNTTAQMVRNQLPFRGAHLSVFRVCIVMFHDSIDPNRELLIVMFWYPTDIVLWPEAERLIHQSVFESMPLTKLDQNSLLLNVTGPLETLEPAQQQTPSIIPWDDPLSYAKQQLNNLRTKGLLLCWLIQLLGTLAHI